MRAQVVVGLLSCAVAGWAATLWYFGGEPAVVVVDGAPAEVDRGETALLATADPGTAEAMADRVSAALTQGDRAAAAESEAETVVRGTISAIDGASENARESGSMYVSFALPRRADESFVRLERRDVTVTDGSFALRLPHVPATVSFADIVLGGRPAMCRDDFAVDASTTVVQVRALWQQSMTLRVLADDTGVDLAGLLVVQQRDWRRDRQEHPGDEYKPVVAQARSPLRLQPQPDTTSARYWVKGPAYAWNQIELSSTEVRERVLRLLPGGDLDLAVQGPLPEGAVVRVRGRADDEPTLAAPLRGAPVAEVTARSGLLRIDGLPARALCVSIERGEWFRDPVVLAHTVVLVPAGGTIAASLVLRGDVAAPPVVAVTVAMLLPSAWGDQEEVELEAFGPAAAWQKESTRLRTNAAERTGDEYRWPPVAAVAGRYGVRVRGCQHCAVVDVPAIAAWELQIVVPSPSEVRVRCVDDDTGKAIVWGSGENPNWAGTAEGWVGGSALLDMRAEADGSFRFRAAPGRINIHAHPEGYEWMHDDFEVRPGNNEFELRIARVCGAEITLKDGAVTLPWPDDMQAQLTHTTAGTGVSYWAANKVAAKRHGPHRLEVGAVAGYLPIEPRIILVEPGKWTPVEIALVRKP